MRQFLYGAAAFVTAAMIFTVQPIFGEGGYGNVHGKDGVGIHKRHRNLTLSEGYPTIADSTQPPAQMAVASASAGTEKAHRRCHHNQSDPAQMAVAAPSSVPGTATAAAIYFKQAADQGSQGVYPQLPEYSTQMAVAAPSSVPGTVTPAVGYFKQSADQGSPGVYPQLPEYSTLDFVAPPSEGTHRRRHHRNQSDPAQGAVAAPASGSALPGGLLYPPPEYPARVAVAAPTSVPGTATAAAVYFKQAADQGSPGVYPQLPEYPTLDFVAPPSAPPSEGTHRRRHHRNQSDPAQGAVAVTPAQYPVAVAPAPSSRRDGKKSHYERY